MYGFPHYLCSTHPHDAGIKDCGYEDATYQEQPKVLDSLGEPPSEGKDGKGEDEERHNIFQGFHESETS